MVRIDIPDWPSFRTWVDGNLNSRYLIWRGQRDPAWPLASSFERQILRLNGGGQPNASQRYPYGGRLHRQGRDIWDAGYYERVRDGYLNYFQRAASGLRGPTPAMLSTDEWWALGRHFGLTTPLLDWSESPYIATYFALYDLYLSLSLDRPISLTGKQPIALYALFPSPELELEQLGFRVLRPMVNELGRMHGQRGLFTWLNSERYFELEGFLEDTGHGDLLTVVHLSDQALLEGIRDLHLHGIDHRLLFPDLEGAARYANGLPSAPL